MFYVAQDYYEANSWLFDYMPDGNSGGGLVEIEGLCDETSSDFGMVNYRNIDGKVFTALDEKNVVRVPGSTGDCGAQCFGKAGCSAFFEDGDGCTYIIGQVSGVVANDDVTHAGALTGVCPSNSFRSTFTRRSEIFCLIWAPDEADNVADSIFAANIGDSDTPLRSWSFETRTDNPLIRSSQYVSITMPDMEGSDTRYRPVKFSIETHVRIGEEVQSGRKRRSAADRESEYTFVGELTEEVIQKFRKQAAKKAKKEAKQRLLMPRTDDILPEIEAIEQQATSFILNGGMSLPGNYQVAATGPIKTVEFVQMSNDGSVAADCSTGTCQCSIGFIDNGNVCEEMTEEQAAATAPPTTTVPTTWAPTTVTGTWPPTTTHAPTTITVQSSSSAQWPSSLVDKLQSVFDENRPGKERTHLLEKWQGLSAKFIRRYDSYHMSQSPNIVKLMKVLRTIPSTLIPSIHAR